MVAAPCIWSPALLAAIISARASGQLDRLSTRPWSMARLSLMTPIYAMAARRPHRQVAARRKPARFRIILLRSLRVRRWPIHLHRPNRRRNSTMNCCSAGWRSTLPSMPAQRDRGRLGPQWKERAHQALLRPEPADEWCRPTRRHRCPAFAPVLSMAEAHASTRITEARNAFIEVGSHFASRHLRLASVPPNSLAPASRAPGAVPLAESTRQHGGPNAPRT